ncbi:MAG: hypothetical protein J6Y37_11365 [Paludibacteraceae bacterium]|nr:hypothetical protein [Paludibacteraceae bacterium]
MDINLEKEETNTVVNEEANSSLDLSEVREFAVAAITEQKHSANWTIKKLIEKGVDEKIANAVVSEIMAPILLRKAVNEAANKAILIGALVLIGSIVLLFIEIAFCEKVHIFLFLAPIYGLWQLGKGLYYKFSKNSNLE